MAGPERRIFPVVPKRLGVSWTLVPLLLVAMTSAATASPTPAEEGKAISGMCAACHGERGIAVDTLYPDLAGQNYQYLVHALESFKDGQRPNDIMHAMTADLSQTQINDLAAYYSAIRPVADTQK